MTETDNPPYDSTAETKAHVYRVHDLVAEVRSNLFNRALVHDASKLQEPEKSAFDEATPKLKALTYGSEEYDQARADLKGALEHHYAHNDHHPEWHAEGVRGMSLMSLMEMLADWKAATERHADGDLRRSLEINQERFRISADLYEILLNTVEELGW